MKRITQLVAKTIAVGAIGASLGLGLGASPAIAATGSSAGPDYSVLVGDWGVSRQAGVSAAAPIVRDTIEMDGNKVSPSTICPAVLDGSDTLGGYGATTMCS